MEKRWLMNTGKAIAALFAVMMGLGTVSAQVRSEQYFANSMPDNSVVYALPQTLLYARVVVEEVEEVPGELALYARQYLGAQDAILQPSKTFRLKSVALDTYGVPDESRRFSVRFRRNSSATYVSLTPEGLLAGINHPTPGDQEFLETWEKDLAEPLSAPGLSPMPPEYIRATTVAKKAEIAAEELYRVRDSRARVVSGESEQPFTDGAALKIAIDRLDDAERLITQYFNGYRKVVETAQLVKGIDPLAAEKSVAFRFSERYGLLPADDLRGEPIYLEVNVTEKAPELDDRERQRKERQLRRGVIYVVPGMIHARLTYRGQTLLDGNFAVAQLGALETLDDALFTTRNVRTAVSFHPSTGSIAEVREVTD